MASHPGTYFMVCGFYPGGYSGIQEQLFGRHLAIFSMWSHNGIVPTVVRQGQGVKVRPFGGEGTGIQAYYENFPWHIGDEVHSVEIYFSITQILREINFLDSTSSKCTIFALLAYEILWQVL